MNLQRLVDDALEIAVVPSFSAIGYSVRHRLFGWVSPPADALRGQTVLITGPTSGLGRATADALAGLGARIVLVGRDRDRLTAVRDDLIRTHGADRFPTVVADMASLGSVRLAARRVLDTETRLDVVVDNAGAIFSERTETPDGYESTFATLVLGPFTLVAGLLPLLRSTGAARVVAVTSGGMYAQRLRLDDLLWEHAPFDGARAYAHAKRAQVALTREWARRVPASEVVFNAMHPGWADTPGISAALPRFYSLMDAILRTPAQGADTTVWLASDPAAGGVTGRVFLDRRPRPFDRLPTTRVSAADRRRLWEVVVGLTGVADPAPGSDRPPTTHRHFQGATT
jgi:dehydrogenase/reductase SDR family protein 12